MSKTDELRRVQCEALAKAPAPHPIAMSAVTPIQIGTEVAANPVSTDVPDRTSACTVAAWQAQGLVVPWNAGVGQPGLEVDRYSIAGHTDWLLAANDGVVGSMRMDQVAQAITGGNHTCGTAFNSNPVSPLFDRRAPIDLSRVGRR